METWVFILFCYLIYKLFQFMTEPSRKKREREEWLAKVKDIRNREISHGKAIGALYILYYEDINQNMSYQYIFEEKDIEFYVNLKKRNGYKIGELYDIVLGNLQCSSMGEKHCPALGCNTCCCLSCDKKCPNPCDYVSFYPQSNCTSLNSSISSLQQKSLN